MDASKVNKRTRGRQRIQIKKLESKDNLEVTFSKRKKGLFNKASELSVLCDAEVAIIIISPHERAFTYGHPSVEALLDRHLTGKAPDCSGLSSTENYELEIIKQRLKESLQQLEEEERIAEEIKRNEANANGVSWWEQPIDDMGMEEVKQYIQSLEQLKIEVQRELAARDQAPSRAEAIVANKIDDDDDGKSVFNQVSDPNYIDQNILKDFSPFDFGFGDGNNLFDKMNMGGFDHINK